MTRKQPYLLFSYNYRLAKEKYVHLRKERDYHRMHHRRTLQEKEKLMTDMKRYILLAVYNNYCLVL